MRVRETPTSTESAFTVRQDLVAEDIVYFLPFSAVNKYMHYSLSKCRPDQHKTKCGEEP